MFILSQFQKDYPTDAACLEWLKIYLWPEVEVDEIYVGEKQHVVMEPKGKPPVVGIVQRKGKIKAVVVSDTKSKTVLPIVDKTVEMGE